MVYLNDKTNYKTNDKTCLVDDDVCESVKANLGRWTKARGAAMFGAWQTA